MANYKIESIKFKQYQGPIGTVETEDLMNDIEGYLEARNCNLHDEIRCPLEALAKENQEFEDRIWELEDLERELDRIRQARDKVQNNLEAILDGKKLEKLTKKDLRAILQDALETLEAS